MYQPVSYLFRCIPLAITIVTLSLSACDKDDDDDDQEKTTYTLNATLNGQQEVPAVTTNATGTFTGSYNKTTNEITYSVSWQQLSGPVTGMHFHGPANAGEPANVALPIEGFPQLAQGNHTGTGTLTEAQEGDLLGGKWYVNIHTDQNKPGEIRGQVTAQ